MRKIFTTMLLSVATVILPGQVMAQTYWDGSADEEWTGDGTALSPYLITSAAELAGLAKRANKGETFEGKYIQLAADIWLSDESMAADERPNWVPIASHDITNDDGETNPGGWYGTYNYFKGVFDGAGHTIHNLWFNGSTNFDDFNDPFGSGQIDFSAFNKALFGGLEGATIKNLNVKNVNIAGAIVAGFAINAYDTDFTDVYIDGHVKSGDIASGGTATGLVQNAYNCDFLRCESNVDVYSYSNAAPFVSLLRAGSTVTDCKAGGTATGCDGVSGFIGAALAWEEGNDLRTPVIRNCSSSGLVTVIPGRKQGNSGGGFIALNSGEIYNCFSTSDLHVTVDVGAGFCVDNRGRIESCYALGNLYNEEYGVSLSAFVTDNGLDAGWSEYYPGTILNCYAAGSLTAPDAPTGALVTPTRIYGFCGLNNVTAGSQMTNCYYDSSKNPTLWQSAIGAFGVSTDYMKSKEFVEELNSMAAVMGTTLWEYNPDGYPTFTDVKATDVSRYFAGGDGTESNPFIVSNKEELENLAFVTNRNWPFRGQYIRQTADIALNAPFENWGEEMPTQWTPIGELFEYGSNMGTYHFCGTYDGDMHTVSNLYIDDAKKNHCGLFGTLGAGAEIKNLGVTDAWISCGANSGILAGAARIHNEADQYGGPSKISHCWTSGQVIMPDTWGTSTGGIIGYVPYKGDFTMDACYSTATAGNGLIGDGVADETFINGSYFAGKGLLLYSQNYFWTFIDQTLNPDIVNHGSDSRWNLPQMGRTTEYMQSPQFVNDLNYAAAYKGYEGGWRYNEKDFPTFTSGVEPSVTVTFNDGVNTPLTFKVIAGSSISNPVTPEKEGEVCLGWYCDKELTKMFEFGETIISEPTELYARWSTTVTPDVSIFKNKFTNTYTINTIEQLYGFAAVVNGTTDEMDQTDFKGKTIKLGADLLLNDVEDFEHWGTNVKPVAFPCIGTSNMAFNGTFDGQGYTLTGLYLNDEQPGNRGLFRKIGEDGVVKNVILKNAYLEISSQLFYAGLLAAESEGIVTQCGVEGKIDNNYIYAPGNPPTIGGMIGNMVKNASLTESYAIVDISSYNSNTGALFGYADNTATISDNFVRGSVHFDTWGNFGSIGCLSNNQNMDRMYGSVSLSWNTVPTGWFSIGGAYVFNTNYPPLHPMYYNKDVVSAAFDTLDAEYAETAFARGTGLTTAEMHRMDSYPGWDFTNVWGRRNDINDGYPYLRWMAPGLANDQDGSGIENVGIDPNAEVTIYDIQGCPVYKGVEGGYSLPSGIYLKRNGTKTIKIVIR